MRRSSILWLIMFWLASTSFGQIPASVKPEPADAVEVVRRFWKAVGDLDGDGVIACLDWPSAIIETSDRGAKPLKTLNDAEAVKAEIERSRNPGRTPQHGDLFGTTVTQVEARLLNANLVCVTHRCRTGGGQKAEESERREFDAVAIVRKDQHTQTWRIMAVTVAQ